MMDGWFILLSTSVSAHDNCYKQHRLLIVSCSEALWNANYTIDPPPKLQSGPDRGPRAGRLCLFYAPPHSIVRAWSFMLCKSTTLKTSCGYTREALTAGQRGIKWEP